jgi:hypothetical protein
MKKSLIISFFLFLVFQPAHAIIRPTNTSSTSPTLNIPSSLQSLSSLKIKEVEKLLGRKMKLKEKIAFKIFQWKLKKELTSEKRDSGVDHGKTSMILGIVGIAALLVPYLAIASIPCAILAIIFGNKARKTDRNNGKAIAGIILGWMTIGIFIIALALLVVILSTWSGFGWG